MFERDYFLASESELDERLKKIQYGKDLIELLKQEVALNVLPGLVTEKVIRQIVQKHVRSLDELVITLRSGDPLAVSEDALRLFDQHFAHLPNATAG